jgi:hypothetical protein
MRLILATLALILPACTSLPNLPDIQNAEVVKINYERNGEKYKLNYTAEGTRSPGLGAQIMDLIR